MTPYDDIIHLPHPDPPAPHRRMSRRDRAAQFAPFAALSGFGAEIQDTAQNIMSTEEYNWEDYD